MLETISTETLEAIFDTLPLEISFVDDTDTNRYYSKGEERIYKRTPATIGKKVQDCHPQQLVPEVNRLLADLKTGRKDVAEFRVDREGHQIYLRYFAVTDKAGKYLGTLEVIQDITDFQKVKGEKGTY